MGLCAPRKALGTRQFPLTLTAQDAILIMYKIHRENSKFFGSTGLFRRFGKQNHGRLKDTERDRAGCGAEGECKNSQAKGSDPDDTSESTGFPYTKGATGRRRAKGNLSGRDGGKRIRGIFLSLFVSSRIALRRACRTPPEQDRQGRDQKIQLFRLASWKRRPAALWNSVINGAKRRIILVLQEEES